MTAIQVDNLNFARHRHAPVLEGVSLRLAVGEVLCLLGANGAGKSTLLQCLLGIQTGWRGEVRITGRPARSMARSELARLMAYVPQAAHTALSFTVGQAVMMGRTPHLAIGASPAKGDRQAVEEALATVGIVGLRDRSFTELSGGERQLALLARALAQDAPIILLDEPTSSLDLGNQGRVLRIVRDLAGRGRSILMTSHLPEHAFLLGGKVAMMQRGSIIAAGDPAAICTEALLSDLYQAPIRLLTGDTKGGGALAACVPSI